MKRRRERKPIRLKDYDYSSAGIYFVTICTHEREYLFGEVKNGGMILNGSGEIVKDVWANLKNRYSNISADCFVIMPNHVHGLIQILEPKSNASKTYRKAKKFHGLSEIVRGFKSLSSLRVNIKNDSIGTPLWQRSFYDRIIRNDDQLHAAIQYIQDNPINWHGDEDNIW